MFNLFKRNIKRIVSIIICILMVLGCAFVATSLSNNSAEAAVNQYGISDKVKGSVILHAWCWSFNTIKSKMAEIADAGFTAVQTSPANAVLVGDGGNMNIEGHWYYHYQPTGYTVGNYQLGSEAEFASMCAEAKKYGIKIIVDVVANHTTPDRGAVFENMRNISGGLYHNKGSNINYGNREEVTQNDLIGLPDCNTHNSNYQNLILDYLKKCVSLGASGFRYDAAKHIELPDDGNYGSNFWPTVLNNGSEFQYGEILQDPSNGHAVRFAAYSQLMDVTASSYGWILRDCITNGNFNASTLSNYAADSGTNSANLVTWVESHDTFANTDNDSVSWKIDNTDIRLAWAVLAARNNGTGLFFSRPANSTTSNRWGSNRIGNAGDDNFKHPEVKAVNKFKNIMAGIPDTISNPNGDNRLVLIQRGSSGLVLINTDNNSKSVNTNVSLPNGQYEDKAHPGTYYTVSNGTISGNISGKSVVVLYDGSDLPTLATVPTTSAVPTTTAKPEPYPDLNIQPGETVVFFDNSSSQWSNVGLYYYANGTNNAEWPGQQMTLFANNIYYLKFNISQSVAVMVNDFTSGGSQIPGSGQSGYEINAGDIKMITSSGLVNYQIPTNPTEVITTAPTTTSPITTTEIVTTTIPTVTTTVPVTTVKIETTVTEPPTTTVIIDELLCGDVDNDNNVNIKDCTKLLKYLVKQTTLTPVELSKADTFKDNRINIIDVTAIQKYIVKLYTSLPVNP